MKKFTIILVVLLAMTIKSYAQIPNNGFENWASYTTHTPMGWPSYGKITRITPGVNSNYALRMERDSIKQNGGTGAILYGVPNGNVFTGGIPFAARPDSLVGYFKYSIAPGDSAWVLFSFKLNDTAISNDLYFITGDNSSNFVRLAFKVNYFSGVTPDSLIIGITSTNPNNNTGYGYMIVDSVFFTNTVLPIPNGNFELWNTFTRAEPDYWLTPNISYPQNATLPVTKTTDKKSGTYAIRIENIITPNGLGYGYALAGPQGNNGPLPGFSVSKRDSTLYGYYKFFPQNSDTVTIGVMMYEQGNMVGGGFLQDTNQVSTYTLFTIPIHYNNGYTGTPDSATIILLPFNGGQLPHGNSVLYVDELSFDTLSTVSVPELIVKNTTFSIYPNPASDLVTLNFSNYNKDAVEISIYNSIGKLMKSEMLKQNHQKINVGDLSNGVYLITIKTKDRTENQKLIIQR